MELRIGTDVIEIERIGKAMRRFPRFVGRILTPAELDAMALRPDPIAFVAGRFAAKEATAKALRGRFGWQDLEILSDGEGAPRVVLHGHAKAAYDGAEVALSISHSRTIATAVAIAAGRSRS